MAGAARRGAGAAAAGGRRARFGALAGLAPPRRRAATTRPCGPEPGDARRGRCRLPWRGAGRAARRRRALAVGLRGGRRRGGAARSCMRRSCSGLRRGCRCGCGCGAAAALAASPQAPRRAAALASSPSPASTAISCVDRHVLRALRHDDLRERALVDRLDFHGRLVGLDLGDHVAGLDLVAFLLQPLGEVALLHRRRERGHEDVDRHRQCPRSSSARWCRMSVGRVDFGVEHFDDASSTLVFRTRTSLRVDARGVARDVDQQHAPACGSSKARRNAIATRRRRRRRAAPRCRLVGRRRAASAASLGRAIAPYR